MENKEYNGIFIGKSTASNKICLEKIETNKKDVSIQIGKLGKGIMIRANK